MTLKITEISSRIWSLHNLLGLTIDRSGTTVAEYLANRGVSWQLDAAKNADVILYKEDVGSLNVRSCIQVLKRKLSNMRSISLIGEPRELAPAAYFFAKPEQTLAAAPGNNLNRLYFASEWLDPQLDGWNNRADRICWFARPTPERISLAMELLQMKVPLDIYSYQKWPLAEWLGHAEDEIEVSRRYRYRLVCENSHRFGYHSEKLFNSIRSGCVTFYQADPSLELTSVKGAFSPLDIKKIKNRQEVAEEILYGIDRFMFTSNWETYSFKLFFDRIISLAENLVNGS